MLNIKNNEQLFIGLMYLIILFIYFEDCIMIENVVETKEEILKVSIECPSIEDTASMEEFVPEQIDQTSEMVATNQELNDMLSNPESYSEEITSVEIQENDLVAVSEEIVFSSDEVYPIHELRENDAEMNADQFNALKLDLLTYEQIVPITLHRDSNGKLSILDGRARVKACKENGMTPLYTIYTGKDDMLYEFIKSKQIHRAHYSKDQLACYAAEAKESVQKNNRDLLSIKMKALANNSGKTEELPKISTQEFLSNMFGVGKTYILDAEKIFKADLKLFASVKSGSLTLSKAKTMLDDMQKASKAEMKKVESDQPLQEKIQKKEFSFVENAKIQEFIDLGLPKKEAQTKVTELSVKIDRIIASLKDEEKVKIELSLPNSINSYLNDTTKDAGYSIDELFTAWVISYTNFSNETNN